MSPKSTPDCITVFGNNMVVLEQGNMREITGPWESQRAAKDYAQLIGRNTGLRVTANRRHFIRDDAE